MMFLVDFVVPLPALVVEVVLPPEGPLLLLLPVADVAVAEGAVARERGQAAAHFRRFGDPKELHSVPLEAPRRFARLAGLNEVTRRRREQHPILRV